MKILKIAFLICSIFLSQFSQALVITVDGLPDQYRVFNWNYETNEAEYRDRNTTNYSSFNFNIPDQYIVADPDGKINLWRSLNNWRSKTPRGVTFPRTSPDDNVTRYPFFENYDPSKPRQLPDADNYVGLAEALKNQENIPGLSLQSSDGRSINTIVPITSLESSLESLRGESVSCTSRSSNPAHCLICNCANEAGGNNEPDAGRVAVGRTVLTRVERKGYPDSICKVVWAQNRSGTSAAFSWTLGGNLRSRDSVSGSDLNQCIEASKQAVQQGAWDWDMFYSGGRPSWYNKFINRGKTSVGGHTFMNSGARLKEGGRQRLQSEISGEQGAN